MGAHRELGGLVFLADTADIVSDMQNSVHENLNVGRIWVKIANIAEPPSETLPDLTAFHDLKLKTEELQINLEACDDVKEELQRETIVLSSNLVRANTEWQKIVATNELRASQSKPPRRSTLNEKPTAGKIQSSSVYIPRF